MIDSPSGDDQSKVVTEHYNPVNVRELFGTLFLGLLSLWLLFALLRAQGRNRRLLKQLAEAE